MSFGRSKDESQTRAANSAGAGSSPANSKGVEAILGKGSRITGNLQFSGPVEIDGYVEGEITAKGKLSIGESANVKAKIVGADIVVRGTVTGDILASEKLSLLRPAKIYGNLTSNNLSIEEGVVFEGSCTMKSTATVTPIKEVAEAKK